MDEEKKLEERIRKSVHLRPSAIMIEQPTYSFADDDATTTLRQGEDNPFGDVIDLSSYGDEDYSGSDLEEEDSFAASDGSCSDGILSPDEIDKHEKQIIARKEHQRVFRARIFVIILLMITAITNSVICYFVTRNQEEEDYRFHYKELTNEIQQITQENVRVAFLSMDAMSRALTTLVLDDAEKHGYSWPMITFPHFPTLARDVRNVSGAVQVTFVPIVGEEQRDEWEQYTVENQAWMVEEDHTDYYRNRALRLLQKSASNSTNRVSAERIELQPQQSSSPSYARADMAEVDSVLRYPIQQKDNLALPRPPLQNQRRQHEGHNLRGVTPERIHPAPTREERRDLNKQYAAVWQMSPPPYYRGIVLHDLYQEPSFQGLSQIVNETRQAILSNLLDDDLVGLLLEDHNAEENIFEGLFQPFDHSHGKRYPPTSVILQPVWRDLKAIQPELVGYVIALIPWEAYLTDTFRSGSGESVLVQYLEDDCDSEKVLNYLHQGGETVEFLGEEKDFSVKSDFDFSMESEIYFPLQPPQSATQSQLLAAMAPTSAPSSAPFYMIDTEPISDEPQPTDCSIVVKLYPSFELRDLYLTMWPYYYALMVFAVFLVLSVSFFIYDLIVEKRRGRAMAVAEKTGRIVTNLFPGQFADQLIAENKQKEKAAKKQLKKSKKKKKKKHIIKEAPNRRLKKFMDSKPMGEGSMQGSGLSPDGAGESPLFLAQSKPIADLFPDTTVLFADIAGFTAWSSVREPSQVFTLLETVYQNFDFLAKQYGIFKIETIGDCYVAVCGLPEPRADHAVAMCRFAMACMQKMKSLVSMLETTLGPDTGDLTMRFGLHSGPVTAGVLRGERARFQLFGDTVNTAARMESTGTRDKIQISQETADLLVAGGKNNWFVKRDELVKAKGKGELQTYFLTSSVVSKRSSIGMGPGEPRRRHSMGGGRVQRRESLNASKLDSSALDHSKQDSSALQNSMPVITTDRNVRFSDASNAPLVELHGVDVQVPLTRKQERLVDWNVEMLQQIIRQIVARRNFLKNASKAITLPFTAIKELPKIGGMMIKEGQSTMPLDEVVEVINLPEFDVAAYHANTDAKRIKLDPNIVSQLRKFVSLLASKYRDNPFHNFDHASHVAMSVNKLLSRIVAPDLASINDRHDNNDLSTSLHLTNDMKDLHDHTYGITSDPLTQLAVVVSALVHDVDHPGVPNNILIKENPQMALRYRNKSVAEQNSVDIAWQIFMDDSFKALRETICPEYTELRRFRQIIVSSVLATDIFDPELSSLRKARWSKAFPPTPKPSDTMTPPLRRASFNQLAMTAMNANNRHETNRRATIVIEHLIQASDVSHTMQHWHIYQKWNECLFQEMYQAFTSGRSDKDPSEGWYKGEIWFFDNYVIPLAGKLKECGVFGVSSDEYLDYATANRKEWEEKGEAIVKEMLAKYKDVRGPVPDKASLGYE